MRKLKLIIICVVGIVFLTEAEEAQPKTLHVSPEGTIQPLGDIHVYPFSTIQAAIDYAEPNDTIIVHEGTYDENGLKINKSVDIVGTGTVTITGTNGAFDSDLKFHGSYAPGTAVLGSMDYVVGVYNGAIVNFTNIIIDGANNLLESGGGQYFAGVAFYNAQGSFSGCEIKRTASNPAYCGGAAVSIYVDTDAGSYELEVTNCTFNTWPKNAISAYGSGSTLSHVLTVDVDDSTFIGNDGSGPSDGFQNGIVGLAGLDIEVHNCTFSAIRPIGGSYWAAPVLAGYAYKADSTRYAPARNLTVSGGCTFSNIGDVYVRRSGGVWITTTGTAVVENCTFTNLKGICVDGSNSCDGDPNDFNPSSQDVTIKDCEFNGPSYPESVDYLMCGVNIQRGAQVDIENCTFDGFHDDDNSDGEGVSFCSAHFVVPTYYTGSTGGSVTGCCTFSDCVTAVYSGTDVTPLCINYNNFDGTNNYGVWNNDADDTIDATNNWWGDATGPYHPLTNPSGSGDEVSDNVAYDPWWADANGDTHGTNPVQNITKVTSYDTIQAAVDDADPNDIIEVAAGTYNEEVVIGGDPNDGITLLGANAGICGTDPSRGPESIIKAPNVEEAQSKFPHVACAIDIWDGADGVTVDGFTLKAGDDIVNVRTDDVVIKNNIITPISDEIPVDTQAPGIFACECTNLTISCNLLLDIGMRDDTTGGCAIFLGLWPGDGAYPVNNSLIEHNLIDNSNGCGILCYDTTGGGITISHNTIRDVGTPGVYHDDGIRAGAYGSGLTIIGNDVYNCSNRGVQINYDGGSHTINYNSIYNNNAYGVRNTDAASVDAEYNWWGDVSGPNDPCGTDETDGITCYDVSTMKNEDGLGDAVSEYVDYCPWLCAPVCISDDPYPAGDLDYDYDVDFFDFAIFADNWLVGTTP